MGGISGLLSGVVYNTTNGKILKAQALLNVWLLKQNGTKDPNGQLIDPAAMEWEMAFVKEIIVNPVEGIPAGLTFNALAERR